MEVAKAKGLPLLKHHLLPRPKGFTLVTSQLAGKGCYYALSLFFYLSQINKLFFILVDYMYDINLGIKDVDGERPSLTHIKNGVPLKCQMFIRRIPMKDIPIDDEKKNAEYLQQLYREKVFQFIL